MKKWLIISLSAISILGFVQQHGLTAEDKTSPEPENLYKIDPTHSTIGFTVKHMQIGTTWGKFNDFSGEIHFDKKNLDKFYAKVIIEAKSIDTGLELRDAHLRGADFFDVENYPAISFESKTLVEKDGNYEITGNLTMHGVIKEISCLISISGPVKSPFGQEVIGLSGETVINRQDYGISWNDTMPDGGFVVGNDVRIIVYIEADRKPEI